MPGCRIACSAYVIRGISADVGLQARGAEVADAVARPARLGELLFSRALADAAGAGRGSDAPAPGRGSASLRDEERAPARHGRERGDRPKHSRREHRS